MIGLIKSYSISLLKMVSSQQNISSIRAHPLELFTTKSSCTVILKILKYSKEIIVHLKSHFVKHSNLWEPLIEILVTFLLILFGRLKWISRSTKKVLYTINSRQREKCHMYSNEVFCTIFPNSGSSFKNVHFSTK